METTSKNQQLPTGLSKPVELPEDTDYRGIAGSASLNASKSADKDGLSEEETESDQTDENNPLVRGI